MENTDLASQIKSFVDKSIEPLTINWELEVPKDKTHGDLATNVAMRLAKQAGKSPRVIAEEIIAKLNTDSEFKQLVEKSEIAGPGFINFFLTKDASKTVIAKIITMREDFGKSTVGKGKQMMVEYGQPNTHKAFHVGHLKSAISGYAIIKLKEALGYQVIKANYFGDIGMHVAKCTWGFMHKERPEDLEQMDPHARMNFIDECYVYGSAQYKDNPEAEAEIKQINLDIYNEVDNEAVKIYMQLREYSLEHQNLVWKELGVSFDREYPESEIYKEAIKIVKANQKTETNPEGIFKLSDNAWIYEGIEEGLTNWVFLTSLGTPTYSAKDLALANKKFEEYPELDHAIVTTSVEQLDYFKVVIRCIEKIRPELSGKYLHVPFGWLLRDNKKSSSRQGGSLKGLDILEEARVLAATKISETKTYNENEREQIINAVALAGLKFLILSHEFHKNINYDPETFISLEGFSGPYVLYSYARAKSVLEKAGDFTDQLTDYQDVLNTEAEQDVLKYLVRYPDTVRNAANLLAPHLIANYVYNLAVLFNKFYSECPIVNAENPKLALARIRLTEAVAFVLKNGLDLLGIDVVERM